MQRDMIETAAGLLARNRLAPQAFAGLPEKARPADIAEGYAIQEALHDRLESAGLGPVAGFKIGCTNAAMQRYLGIDCPCAGGILERTIRRGRVELRHADFHRVGVECEIAVRLSADLPAEAAPFDRDRVAAAVGACLAAIELVDARYRDFRAIDAATLVADDFFNAGCVLGPEDEDWRGLDLAALTGRMIVDGSEVASGTGADLMGHPLEVLAWLANLRAGRGRGLAVGQVILLGSLVEPQWVGPGAEVAIEVDGLGGAGVRFV